LMPLQEGGVHPITSEKTLIKENIQSEFP
jgi:hypothetical protein